jgi:hypothetical protein
MLPVLLAPLASAFTEGEHKMPTNTYIPLATVTLTGNDSQILFSSIPSTYRDLVIVFDASSTGGENLTPTLNGSGSDFAWVQLSYGDISGSGTNNSIGAIYTGRTMGHMEFLDYAQTDKHKVFYTTTAGNTGDVRVLVSRWAQTTPINSIGLSIRLGHSWTTGSVFSLYGVH